MSRLLASPDKCLSASLKNYAERYRVPTLLTRQIPLDSPYHLVAQTEIEAKALAYNVNTSLVFDERNDLRRRFRSNREVIRSGAS
jgi:hypothetical protein